MSFVLEDWALYELLPTPRQRRVGILLVASSYVTWTWQSHTFSNSIETLLVLWTLVLLHRIGDDKVEVMFDDHYDYITNLLDRKHLDYSIHIS